MGPNVRKVVGALSAVVGVMIGVAAVAWACTEAATVSLTPHSGPVGSTTTVAGKSFESGPVSVRWGNESGPELAAAQGPNFAVSISIPNDAVQGESYYVTAVQTSGNGVEWKKVAVFTVSTSQSASGQGSGGDAVSPGGSEEEARAPGRRAAAEQQPQNGTAPVESADSGPGTADSATGAPAGTSTAAPAPGVPLGSSTRRATAAAAPQSSPLTQQAAPASPEAPAGLSGPASTEIPAAEPAVPLSRTAGGDLWAGFTGNGRPMRGPGLSAPLAGDGGDGAGVHGVALIAIGLVALFGVGAVTTTRRRRVALSERY